MSQLTLSPQVKYVVGLVGAPFQSVDRPSVERPARWPNSGISTLYVWPWWGKREESRLAGEYRRVDDVNIIRRVTSRV